MSNLLRRSESDAEIAKLLLSDQGNPTNDEMIVDQAAYHAQQAIEKALKYQLEMTGKEYKKTHNLVSLISDLENEGFPIDDALKSMAFIITGWESGSRYNDDFSAVKTDIEAAINLYEELKHSILEDLEQKTNNV